MANCNQVLTEDCYPAIKMILLIFIQNLGQNYTQINILNFNNCLEVQRFNQRNNGIQDTVGEIGCLKIIY